MISFFAIATSLALTFLVSLHFLQTRTAHQKEPPTIPFAIPFITPFIRLLREKTKFYLALQRTNPLPIYTLRLPGSRVYVINDLSLIARAERATKALSLREVEVQIAARGICDSSPATCDVMMPKGDEEQASGYMAAVHRSVDECMRPGEALDAMNNTAFATLSDELDEFAKNGMQEVGLFAWVRQIVTLATTDALYGPANPFRKPGFTELFWEFESSIMGLLIKVLPSITVRKGYRAREKLIAHFTTYLENDGHKTASALTRARISHGLAHSLPLPEIARLEMAMLVAVLSNTIPTAFWVLYHIYSDPEALAQCRREVSHLNLDTQNHFDLPDLKKKCVTLTQIFNETLRYHSTAVSARQVMHDHLLTSTSTSTYLLRKGNMLLMPSVVQHMNAEHWGSDANVFRHERQGRTGAFRGWGGGTTLCPGRHFASFEVLVFAGMVVGRFDVDVDVGSGVGKGVGKGEWREPETRGAAVWAAVPKPDWDVPVTIRPRE